uniref:Uncharacterized protein n=1 Tax=Oryza nivara TaxID=4536 RepID=A0A0E0FSM6_ORYNI
MLVSARGEGGGEEAGERAERVEAGAAPLPSSVVAPRATSPPRRAALISAGEHAGLPASSLSARPLLSSPPPSRHVPHSAPLSRAALVSAAKHAEGASCVLCHRRQQRRAGLDSLELQAGGRGGGNEQQLRDLRAGARSWTSIR